MQSYYRTLGVSASASDVEIRSAFRVLSLRYHPDRHPEEGEEGVARFREVAEAFEVLISKEFRSIYDQFGEADLKAGSASRAAFTPTANPSVVFEAFFGTQNPFEAEAYAIAVSEHTVAAAPENAPSGIISKKLVCSLEDLYCGGTQKIVWTRRVRQSKDTTKEEEKTLSVDIEPGWKDGTLVIFAGMGNEAAGTTDPAADLQLQVVTKDTPQLRRDGNDLCATVRITLYEALTGGVVRVALPDGRTIPVGHNKVVDTFSEIVVHGEGMPVHGSSSGEKGDLKLKFNIVYPHILELTDKEKLELKKILKQ